LVHELIATLWGLFGQLQMRQHVDSNWDHRVKKVTVISDYAAHAPKVWALATDYGALAKIMKGYATFDVLPSGRTKTGQRMDVMVSLFGKLPQQPYFMEVLECDDEHMVLRSLERGAGVKNWQHTLTVTKTETGSRLTDEIEIDAGVLTFAFALWAKYLYGARHKPRLRMLGERETA
jgi:ligand-binding SRPBCC domain-containing protein